MSIPEDTLLNRLFEDEFGDARSEDSTPEDTCDPADVGTIAETKCLYWDAHGESWEEWAPTDIGINSQVTPASARFALIVRREKRSGENGEPSLTLHSITVQSQLIKKHLDPVFADYRGINTNLKKLTFHAPFHEFFYRWDRFCNAEPNDEVEKSHYKLLFDVISHEITPHIYLKKDLVENGVVSFDCIWTLFEPGSEVYSKVDGQHRLFLLESGRYQKSYNGDIMSYELSCLYIDTNGDAFGYVSTSFNIDRFDKVKPLLELDVLPTDLRDLQPDMCKIRAELEARGKKVETLTGVHYKSYSGAYDLASVPMGASREQMTDAERIMIDCKSFLKINGGCGHLRPLDKPYLQPDYVENYSPFHDLTNQTARLMSHSMKDPGEGFAAECESSGTTKLSRQQCARCTPVLKGFCLKEKTWSYFNVDSVREIDWDEDAFKRLILPHDYKQVMLAFVHSKLFHRRGLIVLLGGEPGTGKTLTSESVAEETKRPLYAISAGELGSSAAEVEMNLKRILELSTRWGAVLLLDECDVFLERRSLKDLDRNRLVSVFLRLLEYYQGILFLTTNRVEDFDPAFESRIDLTIQYPKLDPKSRLRIWETFIARGLESESKITDKEMEKLAKEDFNGRQIKNVVKTARLLAAKDGSETPLELEHIETVMRVKKGRPADVSSERINKGAMSGWWRIVVSAVAGKAPKGTKYYKEGTYVWASRTFASQGT